MTKSSILKSPKFPQQNLEKKSSHPSIGTKFHIPEIPKFPQRLCPQIYPQIIISIKHKISLIDRTPRKVFNPPQNSRLPTTYPANNPAIKPTPSTWLHARIIQAITSKRFHLAGRSKIASGVSCRCNTMEEGKSSPTPVHVQWPFGGEVNKLGEKIVVGRRREICFSFDGESSSPAHDWAVTFGCNVWRMKLELIFFFLRSRTCWCFVFIAFVWFTRLIEMERK